ncbi:MAG: YbaB/EbfC family nucleoid-associated protein [Candidatus Cloacimonetes bacterium]|nr:YbaB/EbfC family nucleoid-associated protein [Candidatus Cloacimonadota bacterium]
MFPGGKKGMQDLMKQAKKMQQNLAKAQEELANTVVEATSGGGMVTVQMNGKNQILSLKIDPEVIDPDDIEMLEDLIIAAINEAHEKVSKTSEDEMSKYTGGVKIPGLF